MAEVVVEQGGEQASSGSVFGSVQGIFSWLGQHWFLILLFLILIAAIVVGIYLVLWYNKKKRREDPMYVIFENYWEAAEINNKPEWITKRRRWWMIVFGAPTSIIFALIYLYMFLGESWTLLFVWAGVGIIIWLIPIWFWYKDVSMRIINVDNRTIGYYRGHARPMDGFLYMLVKTGFKWILFEKKILLKIPENVLTLKTVKVKDKTTGEKENAWKFDKVEIESYVWNERDNYIFIPMTTYYKEASWFYDVTLVEGKKIIDLRQKIANSYHLITQIQSNEQLYSHLGKVVNNAVDSNAAVTAQKKMPERERDVSTRNDSNK